MCDGDKFGSLEAYILCVMMICLEVWKDRALHNVCDDDELEVWKYRTLRIVCDGDRFGSLKVWKFTYCV